jgi:hypothetical protein
VGASASTIEDATGARSAEGAASAGMADDASSARNVEGPASAGMADDASSARNVSLNLDNLAAAVPVPVPVPVPAASAPAAAAAVPVAATAVPVAAGGAGLLAFVKNAKFTAGIKAAVSPGLVAPPQEAMASPGDPVPEEAVGRADLNPVLSAGSMPMMVHGLQEQVESKERRIRELKAEVDAHMQAQQAELAKHMHDLEAIDSTYVYERGTRRTQSGGKAAKRGREAGRVSGPGELAAGKRARRALVKL